MSAAGQGPFRHELDADDAGRRLESVMRSRLGAPRGAVLKALRKGNVKIDGKRVREPGFRPAAGGQLVIYGLTPAEPKAVTHMALTKEEGAQIRARVVHIDDDLLAYDKPPGEAAHGGTDHPVGAIERIRAWIAKSRDTTGFEPTLVHRLDRATSGLLLIARTASALRTLNAAFRDRKVRKVYQAVVRGVPIPAGGRVEFPLYRDGDGPVCALTTDASDGRLRDLGASEARTGYRTLGVGSLAGRPAALVELAPRTGRRHQLRVHMRALGHPIAGDPRYGDTTWNRALARTGLRRLALHAVELRLLHQRTGKKLTLRSRWSREMRALIEPVSR